jgi:hypothetical protein
MFKEIQEKVGTQFADNNVPPVADHEGEYAGEEINLDDIPF